MSSNTILTLGRNDTAVVFIDPQNEVLSEQGAAWAAVGASVTENKTVENMERIFQAAKQQGFEVFISPHYFYPTACYERLVKPWCLSAAVPLGGPIE